MLSRFLLVLSGVFAGLWLRDPTGTLFGLTLPLLVLLALILVVAADRPTRTDSTAHLEEAFRQWLDAWHKLRTGPGAERPGAEQALASAAHMIIVSANDRVVRSLQTATAQGLSPAAVAQLVLDMRRNLRRAGMTVRPADLEALLSGTRSVAAAQASTPRNAAPASFLT